MSTWPSTLPPLRLPVQQSSQDQTLRTSMDAGPQKVRRRFTASSRYYTIPLRLTGADRQTLDTFFNDTLKGGSLEFDMIDPTTDQTEQFRFMGPISARMVRGSDDPDKRLYDIQLNLERLP